MPTKDLVHRDRVLAELVELGPQGFEKMAQLLTPAGVGDDTAVRFAINSLARYASEFGKKMPEIWWKQACWQHWKNNPTWK
jgi:hypothetical protein